MNSAAILAAPVAGRAPALHPRERIAWITLRAMLILLAANLGFNLIAAMLGYHHPYTYFVLRADDTFGDFFSLLRSYPGGSIAELSDHQGLHALVPATLSSSASNARLPPGLTIVTHFHMMPLATLFALATMTILRALDPVATLFACTGLLVLYWMAIVRRFAATARERWLWNALGLLCYPVVIAFTRGNLFAWLTALLLIDALLRGLERRTPVTSALLFAVALNLRPNAMIFAIPLILFYWPQRWRFGVALGAAGLTIVLASFALSNAIYPAYTFAAFRAGLAAYYRVYAVGFWGLPYGSSLFGALKLFAGGYKGWLNGAATAVALAIVLAGAAAHWFRRCDDAVLLFLAAAAYCLGSTVFGDYHLLVLIVVPMALAASSARPQDEQAHAMRRMMLAASALLLAPKHYVFWGLVSAQVILNPLILLAVALALIALALRGPPSIRYRAA